MCYVIMLGLRNTILTVLWALKLNQEFFFPQIQMRLKDPFSLKAADMTKRSNKPKKPRDEESSDEVGGKEKF